MLLIYFIYWKNLQSTGPSTDPWGTLWPALVNEEHSVTAFMSFWTHNVEVKKYIISIKQKGWWGRKLTNPGKTVEGGRRKQRGTQHGSHAAVELKKCPTDVWMEVEVTNGPRLTRRWKTDGTNESQNRCDWPWQAEGDETNCGKVLGEWTGGTGKTQRNIRNTGIKQPNKPNFKTQIQRNEKHQLYLMNCQLSIVPIILIVLSFHNKIL